MAKLQHVRDGSGEAYSLVDVNRAGVPLMETVSEPDMRSAEEARQYLLAFRSILQYLGVSTADMEKGAFRCDANVSVRPVGSTELTSKVEVQEHEQLPGRVQRPGVRGGAAGGAAGGRRPGGPGDARLVRGTAPPRSPSEPKSTPTTTATSRSRTCPRWPSPASGSRRCGRGCRSCRARGETASWTSMASRSTTPRSSRPRKTWRTSSRRR